MYGGGVDAGEVDCAMPIRPSALRGQLRFWWRLLYSCNRPSTEVFEDECALWGGISAKRPQASQVTVRVDCEEATENQLVAGKRSNVPDYGLISNRNEPNLLKQGYNFQLTLEFHSEDRKAQVVNALRWWGAFGGVGARTRRGFGAVEVESADLRPVDSVEVQRLGGRMALRPATNALRAWHDAVKLLKDFRQARAPGSGGKPGRSKWPEADTIRRLAANASARKGPSRKWAHDPVHPVDGVYPRAAFGLPIVFHFKDAGDPCDNTLETAGSGDRMASPLILRPYFDGTGYRPMALLLPGWEKRVGVAVELSKLPGSEAAAWPDDGRRARRRE